MDRRGRLYLQVSEAIRRDLAEGRYADRLPTEAELRDRFQVSLTTVKKALSLLVAEGRIERISGKGTFPIKSASTRCPERSATGVAGFLISGLPDEFSRRLLRGVADELALHDRFLLLGTTGSGPEREAEVIRKFRDQGVDGLIICPLEGELYNEEILRLKLDRFPFVLIDRWLTGIDTPYVVCDNRPLVRAAVEHLVGLGHRRLAMVSMGQPRPWSTQSLAERIDEFQLVTSQLSLESCGEAVWVVDEHDPLDGKIRTVMNRMRGSGVTALIGSTTSDTQLICQAAGGLGLRIPQDLSVVSYDYAGTDPSLVAAGVGGLAGPLTWIDQQEETMGRRAVELLLEVIADPQRTPKALVTGILHPGTSTVPAAAKENGDSVVAGVRSR